VDTQFNAISLSAADFAQLCSARHAPSTANKQITTTMETASTLPELWADEFGVWVLPALLQRE